MKTKEKFENWNILKQKIHFENKNKNLFINEREIRYTSMWINIWFEEDGKDDCRRPVLIIKKVWNIFTCVVMTTKWKDNNKFYYKIKSIDFGKPSYCILSQLKTYDKGRFNQYL